MTDLRALLDIVEGDEPNPEFVAALRAELLAELDHDHLRAEADGPEAPVVIVTTDPRRTEETRRMNGWRIGGLMAAAAAVVLAVIGIAAISDDDTVDSVASGGFDGATALETAEVYIAAVNAGDLDEALSTVSPEAAMFDDGFGEITRAEWEQILAWNTAQGTVLADHQCGLVDDSDRGAIVVDCTYRYLARSMQAIDIAVPITTRLTIGAAGISGYVDDVGSPDFGTAKNSFNQWAGLQGIDLQGEDIDCCGWESVEAAIEAGQRYAEIVADWEASVG